MIFVAHDNTPAAALQALQDSGLEVSPFSLYEGGRERRGTIFDLDIDDAYQLARDADPDLDRYDLYNIGVEAVDGIRIFSSFDEDEDEDDDEPFFDDDDDDLYAPIRDGPNIEAEDGIEPEPPPVDITMGTVREQSEPEEEESTMDTAVQAVMETAETSPPSRITVRKESWSGHEEYNDARPIFVEFAEAIQQSVSVHVPHGTSKPNYRPFQTYDDDRVHVHIFSAPAAPENFDTRIAKFRDHELRLTDYVLLNQPSGELMEQALGVIHGFVSTVGREDIPAAYVFEDAVFITADLVHYPEDFEVLKMILVEASTLFDQDPEERAERRREARRRAVEAAAEEYATLVRRRAQSGLERLRSEYESLNQAIENYSMQLINSRRRYEQIGHQIVAFDDSLPDTAKYKQEYIKLLSLEKVKSATMSASTLTVNTENLYAFDPRTRHWHDIGEFRIEIRAGDNQVRWFNQTRQVDGYSPQMQAPHVFFEGNACLGNFSEIQVSLFENYELATLASMAIAFIETANTDDPAGRHVSKWPEVDEDTARQFETANN